MPTVSLEKSLTFQKTALDEKCIDFPSKKSVEDKNNWLGDFPGGAVVKNPPANAGDTGSIPGPGRSHMPRSN